MALTVHIQDRKRAALALTFDAPRIVIGRGKGCELLLPDPTVSARHASLRQEGPDCLIVDEGSTNGIMLGAVRLPPHTPRVVRDGEHVRIGRMWLELRLGAAAASPASRSRAVALDLTARRLSRGGEAVGPVVKVVEGPDEGTELVLKRAQEHVVGRSLDAALCLRDEQLSRRHVSVTHEGSRCVVRDLGSTGGSKLGGDPLGTEGASWNDGEQLRLGATTLVLHDPVPQALAEILRAPDERMSPSEFDERPPGAKERPGPVVEAPTEAAPAAPAADEDEDEQALAFEDESDLEELDDDGDTHPGYRLMEVIVVLLGLGMLGVSIAGLIWLLGS